MNCSTCRYELSQCLDGRLPSGRRTIVMRHVETCAVCSTFWADLQAAQKLTLRLARMQVSEGFRERLWERIGAGEGTPEAVFRERVPLLTKFRYALTGAAAAALILLGVTWARGDREAQKGLVAKADRHSPEERRGGGMQPASDAGIHVDANPWSSARPFSCEAIAVESAKQLEQRYATATSGIRKLNQNAFDQNAAGREAAVREIFEDTDEFCKLGGVLLELRDLKRLSFTDSEVDVHLRTAVSMLRNSQQHVRNLETVRSFVAPALQHSGRLASVSRTIMLPPSDPREEGEVLMRLVAMQHDVFPKLFIVFGDSDEAFREFSLFAGSFFVTRDECGPIWVAPRSEVEAADGRLRALRSRMSGGQKWPGYQVQIHTEWPRQSATTK